ncbi:hypothetical protein HRbin01_01874 [archaeon HR01]|nr:hypothetical protein HRbin01_01874 [archaeon HR01]
MGLKKVWFDILTPKQFWFFTAIGDTLMENGYEVMYTGRRYEQLTPLLELSGRDGFYVLGEYGGGDLSGKLMASLRRAVELAELVSYEKPDCSVSSGSPEASRIAYGLDIPHVLVSDTPYSPVNPLSAPLSKLVMSPWVVGKRKWRRYGVSSKTIKLYRGLDPVAWLRNFKPDRSILERYSLVERGYILLRTPEYKASYLSSLDGLGKFMDLCRGLIEVAKGYDLVVLPRYGDELESVKKALGEKVKIIPSPVYGPSIIYYSAILVGGGGTMNQEAALLGVPCISAYPSRLPEVIQYLARQKMISIARSPGDLIRLIRRMINEIEDVRALLERRARRLMSRLEDPSEKVSDEIRHLLT